MDLSESHRFLLLSTGESSTIYAQANDIVIKTFNTDDLTSDYSKVILVVVSNLDPNKIVSVTDKGVLKEGTFRFDEEKNLILVTKTDQTLESYLGELLASSTYKYDPSVQELSDLSKHRYDSWQLKFLDLQKLNKSFEPELSHAITQTVASGWYLRGMETAAFEHSFAVYCHRKYCVGTANGLDALTLVLAAQKRNAGWPDGAEVIVPAMTFVATAQAVVRAGLNPVFVDVDDHALLDISLFSKR